MREGKQVLRTVARRSMTLGLCLSVLLLGACATATLPEPMASASTVGVLRGANLAPASVGEFKLADGKPVALDQGLTGGLRGSNITAPGGSFAQHLRATLVAELRSAGLIDDKSNTVITGQLTDSMVDAAIGTGTARLAARFVVRKDGKVTFDKELAITDSWESSFVGAVAIPLAIEKYGALYRGLVAKLTADPEFKLALGR